MLTCRKCGSAHARLRLQAVAAAAGGGFVLFARYGGEGLRSRLEDIVAPAFGFVGSCYEWARERLTGDDPSLLPSRLHPAAASVAHSPRQCAHANAWWLASLVTLPRSTLLTPSGFGHVVHIFGRLLACSTRPLPGCHTIPEFTWVVRALAQG